QQVHNLRADLQSNPSGGDNPNLLGLNGNGNGQGLGGLFVPITLSNNNASGGVTDSGSGTGHIPITLPSPPPNLITPPQVLLNENVSNENSSNPITGVTVGPAGSTVVVTLTVSNGFLHVNDSSLPPGVTSITGDDTNTLVVKGDATAVNNLLSDPLNGL